MRRLGALPPLTERPAPLFGTRPVSYDGCCMTENVQVRFRVTTLRLRVQAAAFARIERLVRGHALDA